MTDHIKTNNFWETNIKTRILKFDISDHFLVFLISKTTFTNSETYIKWRNRNSEALQEFKQILSLVDWDSVTKLQDVNATYNHNLFLEIKIKNKTLNSPWVKQVFKVLPKENKNYLKSFSKKKQNQWKKIQDTSSIIQNTEQEI